MLKIAFLTEMLNLKFSGKRQFATFKTNLFPVTNEAWEAKRISVFSEFQIEDLWLSGHGRCYSPRHSA